MTYYQSRIIDLSLRREELWDYVKRLEAEGFPHDPSALSHWNRYQDGILYQAGGWSDQPNWYVEDMHYVSLQMELEEIPLLLEKYQKTVSSITARNS